MSEAGKTALTKIRRGDEEMIGNKLEDDNLDPLRLQSDTQAGLKIRKYGIATVITKFQLALSIIRS